MARSKKGKKGKKRAGRKSGGAQPKFRTRMKTSGGRDLGCYVKRVRTGKGSKTTERGFCRKTE